MLREDFSEIFDYLTRKAATYFAQLQRHLITPTIARFLTRKGSEDDCPLRRDRGNLRPGNAQPRRIRNGDGGVFAICRKPARGSSSS